jgi:hypothetical protein
MYFYKDQKGVMTILLAVLVIAIVFSISSGMFILNISRQKELNEHIRSAKAYYAAESAMEDALHRLSNSVTWTNNYSLNFDGASSTINISEDIGGSRSITVTGESSKRLRKLLAAYQLTSEGIGFHYGAQAGDGGLIIANGCTIDGNIYSNGPIVGSGNHTITGTAIVAKNTGTISGAKISGDAYVAKCTGGSTIGGNLITDDNDGCSAGSVSALGSEIATSDLPVTQEMVDKWKIEAEKGGTIVGDINLAGGSNLTIGPKKINGNITMTVDAKLNIKGTLWVTGNITIRNNSVMKLVNDYGSLSGVVMADGLIDLDNSAKAKGSGQVGSYLMLLSTKSGNPAISIGQSFDADILFTLNGWVRVKNSTNIREITGYGIHLSNNSGLNYETGIANAVFTMGPGGSWEVITYKEIE